MNEKELILKKGEQPIARITDQDLNFLINREFPNHAEFINSKLLKLKSDTSLGRNRIAASILKLADKDLLKIDSLIRQANEDYRDIVSKTEYPRASSYEFGERNEEENKDDYIKDWEEYSDWKLRDR